MGKHTKVPLSSIKALTFHAGRKSTARRTKPEPQLTCVAGPCRYAPDVVQCVNTGDDGTGPQWKCEADLVDGVKFGPLEVVCEGWSRAGDTNVLAGSCGLEYELVGAPRYPGAKVYHSREATKPGYTGVDYFLFGVYAAVGFWLVRKLLRSFGGSSGPARRPPGGGGGSWFPPWGGGWGGGGGGGGGGGPSSWGTPPPPYQRYPKPTDPSSSSNSGPGFWSGVAAGAAGAGVYNWATRPAAPPQPQEPPIARATYNPPPTQGATTARYDAQDAPGPSRRATGYGGTRTR
ncbi:Store-operated calcium entry-associated regulatory factor [Vanrija pseudolonga]|uniref:Store-operated calcium entry-associated regulatory factor n=1 Tax=Vanrija pseudolonga TaxID=143232 RepID=A0AAF1BFD1_9TREE|nr:Store-operated calcium entry-associated regulatory factor [Vanrija pseudolonga]